MNKQQNRKYRHKLREKHGIQIKYLLKPSAHGDNKIKQISNSYYFKFVL